MIGEEARVGADKPMGVAGIADDDPDLGQGRGYANRILDAYADMRASTRDFIKTRPSEARLLLIALLSDVIFFVARSISLVVAPPTEVAAGLPQHISLAVIAAFLFRTSAFYVIAAAATVVSRIFGGTGNWHATRCAVFWAALVSAPIELIGALITVFFSQLRNTIPLFDSEWLIQTPYFLGPIAFGFFLSAGVAEAQGFRYTYRVMAMLAIIGFGLLFAVAASGLFLAG